MNWILWLQIRDDTGYDMKIDILIISLYISYFIEPDNQKTLKAPIMTADDDKFCHIFLNFEKKGMLLNENRLPADDSHEKSCLICYF